MKIIKKALAVSAIVGAVFAANTTLSLESCQNADTDTVIQGAKDALNNDNESPEELADNAAETFKSTADSVYSGAKQAAEEAGSDITESGKSIGQTAVNGAKEGATYAAKGYLGFIGNIISNIRENWDALIYELSHPNEVTGTPKTIEEVGEDSREALKDAWEGKDSSQNTPTITEDTQNLADDINGIYSSAKDKITSIGQEAADLVTNDTNDTAKGVQTSKSLMEDMTYKAPDGSTYLIPAYSGEEYLILNGNTPFFTANEMTTEPFEFYSELDSLGRCGQAYANICKDLMPTTERESIGMIKPTGWHQNKYDSIKDDSDNPQGYLMSRCHLIAFSLAGENANPKNLISGTFYYNGYTGMESYEMQILSYVKKTSHHVLYRVTPLFKDDNLFANGSLLEARSVEDDEICFNVFCYNQQPGIIIDYTTGENWEE